MVCRPVQSCAQSDQSLRLQLAEEQKSKNTAFYKQRNGECRGNIDFHENIAIAMLLEGLGRPSGK